MAPIGFWGSTTATIDWCEENYAVTPYIAEFWNTLSNLGMLMSAFAGGYYAAKNGLERRFLLCYISLALVGLGSWCFHMTMKYETQLMDELPMLWGSLTPIYVQVTLLYEGVERSRLYNGLLKLSLIVYGLLCSGIYLCLKTPILFQIAYGLLVALTIAFDIAVVRYRKCNLKLLYAGVLFYLFALFLWLVDNLACQSLRNLRHNSLPTVLAPFSQLHAGWHLCAGFGCYLHLLFFIQTRALSKGKQLNLQFSWCTGVVLNEKTEERQN